MFYRPGTDDHGLPHNPFKAIVSPRPIGWISTLDEQGRANLAPYSFFNAVGDSPPMVVFSTSGRKADGNGEKDSLANIRKTKQFCVNIVSYALKDAMNITSGSYPQGEDEFELAGLEKGQSKMIAAPFVKSAPAALECVFHSEIELPGNSTLVLGQVVGIHLDPKHIRDGVFDVTSYRPLARLGYHDYAVISELFALARPGQS